MRTESNSVAAIVLAAGASTRLGTAKQMARLGTESLLQRTVRVAVEAGLSPVLGVVRTDLAIEPVPAGMVRIVNDGAAEGMASSIRAGLRALAAHRSAGAGVILLACDQPAVTVEHLRELADGGTDVVASGYAGRKGVPAYFPRAVFGALLALRGDIGARELLRGARSVPLPGGALDIDTAQDLEEARKIYHT